VEKKGKGRTGMQDLYIWKSQSGVRIPSCQKIQSIALKLFGVVRLLHHMVTRLHLSQRQIISRTLMLRMLKSLLRIKMVLILLISSALAVKKTKKSSFAPILVVSHLLNDVVAPDDADGEADI